MLRLNLELVDRAVRYWIISESPLPPEPDAIRYRDMAWDDACYEYRYALDFFEDQIKLSAKGMIGETTNGTTPTR